MPVEVVYVFKKIVRTMESLKVRNLSGLSHRHRYCSEIVIIILASLFTVRHLSWSSFKLGQYWVVDSGDLDSDLVCNATPSSRTVKLW